MTYSRAKRLYWVEFYEKRIKHEREETVKFCEKHNLEVQSYIANRKADVNSTIHKLYKDLNNHLKYL